ncbi:ABC transporter permease [Salipiger sp. PrR003]|uniref:ABC transporter permease n=1 Tax=Salipiger sp. PrR003 TaxID=2706776 RepID=UPI0013DBAA6E|nr:ABC transporter permease [Salipiger sp. PrR003]NDV50821.1 ABC transporter permease [Salipiger sp. PrR003]
MSVRDILRTRLRVIDALLLREAKKRFGGNLFGLATAFLEPMIHVAFFAAIFTLTDRGAPHGANVLVFMVAGVMPFHLFSKTMVRGMTAIDANKSLLSYPIMKPIDTLIARCILEVLLYTISFMILVIVAFYFEMINEIARFPYVFFGFAFAALLGFACGILTAAVLSLTGVVKRVVPILNRALFLTSGVFFCASMIPQFGREVFLWNPLLNISEMVRYGLFQNFPGGHFNIGYTLAVILGVFTLGTAALVYAERSPKASIRGT